MIDFDQMLSAFDGERLTLHQAAKWSGYSEEHLRRMVRQGKLPDRRPSKRGRIFMYRSDLPARPGVRRDWGNPAQSIKSSTTLKPAQACTDLIDFAEQIVGHERAANAR